MSVSYKREMNHNYLIINSAIQETEGYECKMMSSNNIEGLLKFRIGHFEEKKEFYYEITSKQPLDRILNQRAITGKEVRSMLLSIAHTLGKIEEFLLREEQIMLEPEYIYVDPDHFKVYLCMVPGYFCNFPEALSALLGYLIGKINHQDKEGVVMAYNLYHESLKENYGLSDLLKHLSAKDSPIFNTEQKELIEKAQPVKEVKEPEMNFREPEKNVRESVKKDDAPVFLKPEAPKNNHIFVNGLKIIVAVAVAEVLLWIFTGVSGLVKYGLFAGGALTLSAGIIALANSRKQEKNVSKNAVPKEVWQLVPQEKSDKDWTEWIESDNIGECENIILPKEPETALLTAKAESSRFALLESLSRERENITISYVPFVIGKHSEMTDYCLRQPTVSRLHLRIDQKEGVYIATDLNSTNGTIVEGYHLQANETVSIKNGDTIYMANAGYRFLNSDFDKM